MECAGAQRSPGHAFQLPTAAVDGAMLAGSSISADLPFTHKTGIQIISAYYASDQDAAAKIPQGFAAFYRQKYRIFSGKHGP